MSRQYKYSENAEKQNLTQKKSATKHNSLQKTFPITSDHFVKETLRVKKYIRYVDDFALFSDDKEFLEQARIAIEQYLNCLRLEIHPIKSQLSATKHGATFLGFRVLPDRIRVRAHNLRRGRKRLRRLQQECEAGKIQREDIQRSLTSWFAHLAHGDTWRLREKIVSDLEL